MSNQKKQIESTASPVGHAVSKDPEFFKPDVMLIVLTWVAFAILLVILKKFAWKPILDGLDQREANICKAVDEAEAIRVQLANIEQTRAEIVSRAQTDAQLMVEQARHAAREAGKVIEKQTKDQVKIALENADRDAKDAANKAYSELKKQSADLVVNLASKLIRENMNDDKNKKFVAELLKDG